MSVVAAELTVPESLGSEATAAGPHEALGGQILLRLPDIGRILIEPDRVVCEADPRADPHALSWLAGRHSPVAQALLREQFSLWAAGVVLDGRAVAIARQDSVGKWTVAAELGRRGHKVLSDWRLPVDTSAHPPVACGTGGDLEVLAARNRGARPRPRPGRPAASGTVQAAHRSRPPAPHHRPPRRFSNASSSPSPS